MATKDKQAEETAETTVATVEEKTEAQEIKLVYIGPSIPKSGLRNGQILTGTEADIEAFVAGFSEQYPELRHLLASPEKLADARRRVQENGNILNKYYNDVAAKARTSRRGG